MLIVGDKRVRIRVVEDKRTSRIDRRRCGLCMDKSALWRLHIDKILNARAGSRLLGPRRAAGSHAGDTRTWFMISGLIC